MEFKIPVEELQSVVSRLSNVIKINENNITGMVVIEVGEDVKFKATDGSVSLIINNDRCEIINTGKAIVRFRDIKGYVLKFVPLVDDYGTKDFHIITEGPEGLIKSKTQFPSGKPSYRRLRFEMFNNETFPSIKDFGEAEVIINSSILKRGIAKVLHCVNPSEVRKSITGLNVTIDDSKIVFVGTNGVKLAEFEMEINADIAKKSYIFKYNLSSILRSVLDDDAQVFMKFEGRLVYIKSNDMYITGSLLIGESYPDYKPMFDLDKRIIVPRIDFTDSVHTVMDVLDPEDNNRLTLNFSGKVLTLRNDRVESVHEFGDTFEHELDTDINGEFLDSILNDFIGEDLSITFAKDNNYIVFQSVENPSHTSLLTTIKRR